MYRVMIVDDEYMIHLSLKKLVESASPDFQVGDEAEDGTEALELLKRNGPDVVITDICMPEMDGLEFIEKAREIDPSVHFIIISGYDDFEYARKAIRFGVRDFLLKPIDPDQFLEALTQIHSQLVQNEQQFAEDQEWFAALKADQTEWLDSIWSANEEDALRKWEDMVRRFQEHESGQGALFRFVSGLFAWLREELKKRDFPFSEKLPALTSLSDDRRQNLLAETKTRIARLVRDIRDSRNLGSRLNILKAVKYMEEHYGEETLSLQDVARHIGLSPAYFSRSFKEHMNVSFIRYLIRIRMENARALLEDPEITVTQAAYRVGFSDYPHFSKTFKKFFGMTPAEYRKQTRIRLSEE